MLKRWSIPTIVAGLALAFGELIMHATPSGVGEDERVAWDAWLSLAALMQVLALTLPLAKFLGRSVWWRVWITVLVLGVWGLRRASPLEANGALALAGLGLGGAIALVIGKQFAARPAAGWIRAFGFLAGLSVSVSTTGLLAELFSQQRRWTELSLMGLPAAALQLAAAGCLTVGFLRLGGPMRLPLANGKAGYEVGWLGSVLAGWIVFGFGLAWWTGRSARVTFEQSLMARARSAAFLINSAEVSVVLAPELKLQEAREMVQQSGRHNPVTRAPYLLSVYKKTADDLARVDAANPGVLWAHLMTFRGGYVISCVFSSRLKLVRDSVALHRVVTDDDRSAWAERKVLFEGPLINGWGELVRARAPVVHPQSGMLGWVALDFAASEWTAVQALARLQTFSLIGAGAVVMLLVLIQRVRAAEHEMVRQQSAAAHAADRAKTAFLAKVSHELRTPIQSILGYGELLSRLSLGDDGAHWLAAVRSHGILLTRLVNDLLDLSALQSGAFRLLPKPGNLHDLLVATVDSLRPRATDKRLALRYETTATASALHVYDPDRVRQVLLNLISNGIKFTDQGAVSLDLKHTPDGVEISVTDTGPGIMPDDQSRLFRPFGRLDHTSSVEGAGLGLALSQALCQEMGGEIELRSDGRTGSTFTVKLPLPEAEKGPVESAVEAQGIVSLVGLRVLVADDNTLVRELFLVGLRQAGAWCDSASDGLEAVELCARESYDVLILDLSMPWLDGFEVARRIRASGRPGPRIVGVSAHATSAEQNQAEAVGMEVFIIKPVGLGTLIATVAKTSVGAAKSFAGTDLALLRRLRTQFRVEAGRLRAELVEAAASHDRRWLSARAHYLKNSADVAGYAELSLLCRRMEEVTAVFGADSRAEIIKLAREIDDELVRILSHSASLSSVSSDDSNKNQ